MSGYEKTRDHGDDKFNDRGSIFGLLTKQLFIPVQTRGSDKTTFRKDWGIIKMI